MDTVQHDAQQSRASYPANWDDLRRQVLERADYCCEGSARYPDCRAENGRPHPVTGSMVVLAAAHLYDDDEGTEDIARLRALCQRCHTAYDADLHLRRASENRAARHNGADGSPSGPQGRRISIYDASVKAATVEVKALVVTGKQVTLSVFRQLQDEDLIDPQTAQLRGVPWGKVNYFFGDCKPDHLHVVWQTGVELRRACVRHLPPADPWSIELGKAQRAEEIWRLLLDDTLGVGRIGSYAGQDLVYVRVPELRLVPEGRACAHLSLPSGAKFYEYSLPVSKALLPWFQWRHRRSVDGGPPAEARGARQRVLDHLTRTWGDLESVCHTIRVCQDSFQALRAEWRTQYDALVALDQLFIAL